MKQLHTNNTKGGRSGEPDVTVRSSNSRVLTASAIGAMSQPSSAGVPRHPAVRGAGGDSPPDGRVGFSA